MGIWLIDSYVTNVKQWLVKKCKVYIFVQYSIGGPLSSVCVYVCMSSFSNIFSSETTGPIEARFHMEPPWDEGTKVCSNSLGHMTKMTVMPIYSKNLQKIFFSGTKRPMTLKLGMQHQVLPSLFKWWPCVDLDLYLTARSNLVPYAFVWEKGKTMDFSETITVCDLKLATDDRRDKKFLLTSKLCPLGAVCPLPRGYIHVLNHKKKWLEKDYFKTWQQMGKVIRPFCWHQNFVCPCLRTMYMHWIMKKKLYKTSKTFFWNI